MHLYSLRLFDDYVLYDGHDSVALQFVDVASCHLEVVDECRVLERFALHQVHSDIGQRRVANIIDRKRFPLDCTKLTIGDRQ